MKYARFFAIPALILALSASWVPSAQAGLLEDDEARRAILDLRQRVDRHDDTLKQLQTNSLEQQNMFESLRAEIAKLRGEKEELEQVLKKQNSTTTI